MKDAAERGLVAPSAMAVRMNWQQYPYWLKICGAQQKLLTWSPTEIVKYLQKTDPDVFNYLHPATLAKWIVKDGDGRKSWSPAVLTRVEMGKRSGATSRSKALVCDVLLDQ